MPSGMRMIIMMLCAAVLLSGLNQHDFFHPMVVCEAAEIRSPQRMSLHGSDAHGYAFVCLRVHGSERIDREQPVGLPFLPPSRVARHDGEVSSCHMRRWVLNRISPTLSIQKSIILRV